MIVVALAPAQSHDERAIAALETEAIQIRSLTRSLTHGEGVSDRPAIIDVHDGIATARALTRLGSTVEWGPVATSFKKEFRHFDVPFMGCTVSGCAYAEEVAALLGGYLPDPYDNGDFAVRTMIESRYREEDEP